MFKRILVAIDGSSTSNHGFNVALELAKDQLAQLIALHVVDETSVTRSLVGAEYGPPDYFTTMLDDLRKSGRKILSKAEAAAAKNGSSAKTVMVDTLGHSVAHAILEQARKLDADLIVMGTHGRRGLSRLVMGSDAEGVLREARVPVLLVRAPAARRASRHVAPPVSTSEAQKVSVRRTHRVHA
jgi:nucleotide-binding universal stress UspA family protein